jgi:hypothetical protein
MLGNGATPSKWLSGWKINRALLYRGEILVNLLWHLFILIGKLIQGGPKVLTPTFGLIATSLKVL